MAKTKYQFEKRQKELKKKKKMEEKRQRKLEKSGNLPSENPEPSPDQSDTVSKDE
ncbi:MAG TPA: hypothetical protein VI543_03860 [Sulfuricaulis sp.]|nr:hypothetical protein [Sulfuricaulis sp.]